MPSRILREGILTSDRVNALSIPAELFYRRLMSVVDDFGRFDARPVMLKISCFPLRVDAVREADIPRWIAECEKAGLIVLYAVGGKPYLEMQDFKQSVRAKQSKYPERPMRSTCDADATQMPSECIASAPEYRSRISDIEGGDEKGAREASPALPPWLPVDKWAEWKRHRGRKLTPEAVRKQLAKLEALRAKGLDPGALIDAAIESGWGTFWPPKGQRGEGPASARAVVAAGIFGESNARTIDGTAERIDG